ncbi:ABC transporter ATP-binding protein [Bacillus sp. JJ1503]|uniref:ABC transporter ATP-binding protein n=1 Tax=Bacillus sp. JJ1503 TaxID=3122956 RepID=UPI003000B199
MDVLLEMKNVKVEIETRSGTFTALDLEQLSINRGETIALVGETGSGKSMTASAIMNLFPTKKASIKSGSILFEGVDLVSIPEKKMEGFRGKSMTMIFQDPMTSLNPVFPIGEPMINMIRKHLSLSKKDAKEKAIESLSFVGLPDPKGTLKRYPHELSGGQRQRVMIAMAMACNPKLLIADEPTTALDVTIQSQILYIINRMKETHGTSILFITHNLSVVSKIADRIVIMYGGHIVETGRTKEVFQNPKHPYTTMLMDAIPKLKETREKLPVIDGMIDRSLTSCPFFNRCPSARPECNTKGMPNLTGVNETHKVACNYPNGGGSVHD